MEQWAFLEPLQLRPGSDALLLYAARLDQAHDAIDAD